MSSSAPDTTKSSQITADASVKAAQIQADSEKENRALQADLFSQQQDYLNQQDTYNKGLTVQNQTNWQPYINAGQGGLSQLSGAVQDPNSWLNKTFTGNDLQNDPGYQFRLDQGQTGLNNSLAAKGGLLSGAALKATSQYQQGVASDEYNNAYSRFTNDRNNRYSQLSNLANLGVTGASGYQGGSAQSTTGTQMANISGQYGQNLGNIISQGANAQSNITLANAQAQAQLAMPTGGMSQGGKALSGAASGAMAGAALGPWGALAGGVIGGLSSLL